MPARMCQWIDWGGDERIGEKRNWEKEGGE